MERGSDWTGAAADEQDSALIDLRRRVAALQASLRADHAAPPAAAAQWEAWDGTAIKVDGSAPFAGTTYLPPVPHIELVVSNLSFDVNALPSLKAAAKRRSCRRQTVRLLNGISCTFKSGQLVALMGSSGSGKTTLLDLLAQRAQPGAVGGTVRVNGLELSDDFKKITSYLPQQDRMWETLTVEEQITFQARFRLPRAMAPADKSKRVTDIMDKLGLQNCAGTRIGGSKQAEEISGGERKRTSVGSELVTNPAVLFLDEP